MAQIDLKEHPELGRALFRRESERNSILMQRNLERHRGQHVLDFWRDLAERADEIEELDNLEVMLRELKSDIDMLQGVMQTLSITRETGDNASQIAVIIRLIRTLLDIFEVFKKRHWQLRDRLLAYHMSINRAVPSRARDKFEAEKDSKKGKGKKGKGQAKAKKALEETQKAEPKKVKKPPRQARPDKKMEA